MLIGVNASSQDIIHLMYFPFISKSYYTFLKDNFEPVIHWPPSPFSPTALKSFSFFNNTQSYPYLLFTDIQCFTVKPVLTVPAQFKDKGVPEQILK